MKIVISPAKSLNFETPIPYEKNTKGKFIKEAKIINKELKKLKPEDLSILMDISINLADLNWKRNKNFKTPFTLENSRQSIYAFDGEVYNGLEAYSLAENKIEILQQKLRILSGQYGILKPLDLMQPYRLEMGTKIAIDNHKNLYDFWKEKITSSLNKELKKNELFINLASSEYFSVIDIKKLKVPVITPEFKDFKNGQLKMISFFAKKARGLMVRFIIDNNVETLDELKNFNSEGYQFDSNLSNNTNLVFTR